MGKAAWLVLAVFFGMICGGCGGGGGGGGGGGAVEEVTTVNATVSWNANRDAAVNRTNGGYRVYYSGTADFDLAGATLVEVPYTSGERAPTSIVISLSSGTYYFKVVAYSSLEPDGSPPSEEVVLTVP